jgi:hypothetical protein
MFVNANLLVLSTLIWVGASAPVGAQPVFKCRSGRTVTYSHQPCSKRIVNTDQAPVAAKPNPKEVDVRRLEENRALARVLRKRPGESAEQFKVRQHRAGMLETDRAECARLDKRIPVERARMKNLDEDEVSDAQAALGESRKRFSELKC